MSRQPVAIALSLLALAALPRAQERPSTIGTALILGQVIEAGSNTPVPGATVSISGTGTAPRRVFADGQGRFTFGELPAGSFMVSATATGYQSGAAARTQSDGPPAPVILRADQKLGNVRIVMWKYAAISGTVTDEAGEPVVNTPVWAMRKLATRFSLESYGRTDDRGMYRIPGVSPGEFVVSVPTSMMTLPASIVEMASARNPDGSPAIQALSQRLQSSGVPYSGTDGIRVGDVLLQTRDQSGRNPIAREDGTVMVQPTVYFPGAHTIAGASILSLRSGEERTSVDMQLASVKGVTVSGTLVGNDAGHLGVRLLHGDFGEVPLSAAGVEAAATISDASGQFTFVGVPAGSYQLRVLRVPRPPPPFPPGSPASVQAPPPTGDPLLFAQLPVAVGDTNVNGLTVPLRAGPRVSGRVQFDGQALKPAIDPRIGSVRVTFSPVGAGALSGSQATVNADGSFRTASMGPGQYLIGAVAPGWTTRSAMVNGKDAMVTPVELDDDDVNDVVVTFFDRPAQLTGTVRTARGEPDATAVVLLIAANYHTCAEVSAGPRCVRSAPVTNGTFTMSGIIPGDYLAVALDNVSAFAAIGTPLAVLNRVAPLATRISLSESARQSQDLTTRTLPPQ